MLNSIPTAGAARQPRGVVQLGGVNVPGWARLTITENDYEEADTFRIEYAANGMPTANGPVWLSQQTEIFAEIFTGEPQDPDAPNTDDLTSLIYGRVDDIEYDIVEGTITLTGRDLTGAFIDAKITDQYVNQTSSQVAEALAALHGLNTDITTTTTRIGTYYQIDQVKLQSDRSEWEVLCYLARQEGFVVYVDGQTLYFGPDVRDQADPYMIQWQPATSSAGAAANVSGLRFSRGMTVVKGSTVTVRSSRLTSTTPVTVSYPTASKAITPGKASPYGATQTYYFNLPPGHTVLQCLQFAQLMYQRICAHAMKVTGELPADELMSVSAPLQVDGTGTDWDQTYYLESVVRELGVDGGYSMSFSAKNTTPELLEAVSA